MWKPIFAKAAVLYRCVYLVGDSHFWTFNFLTKCHFNSEICASFFLPMIPLQKDWPFCFLVESCSFESAGSYKHEDFLNYIVISNSYTTVFKQLIIGSWTRAPTWNIPYTQRTKPRLMDISQSTTGITNCPQEMPGSLTCRRCLDSLQWIDLQTPPLFFFTKETNKKKHPL